DDPLGYAFIIDQSQSEEYFHYLDQYLSVGLPFFNCEYALNYSDSAYAKEYIPFVTRRSLSKLITIPPPDILSAINSHEEDDDNLPTEYALFQNYPNPFNHSTTIKYSIAKFPLLGRDERSSRLVGGRGLVTLKVYDILGREIATLVNKEQSAGSYEVQFNASNLASGIYFYMLQSGKYIRSKKMIILK
ncbi:MAG: T9SS type A sorting domain-containing protein, partial [Chlorobi bacterium]|nr:T9SS type A sorting domain-containing protein [Chlorobiota bacterium]